MVSGDGVAQSCDWLSLPLSYTRLERRCLDVRVCFTMDESEARHVAMVWSIDRGWIASMTSS